MTARLLHTSAAVVFMDAYASVCQYSVHIGAVLLQMQTPEDTGELVHSTKQTQAWTACPLAHKTQPWSPCNLTTTVLSSAVVALFAAAVAFYSQW